MTASDPQPQEDMDILGRYSYMLGQYPECKAVIKELFIGLDIDAETFEDDYSSIDYVIAALVNNIRQTDQKPSSLNEINLEQIRTLLTGDDINLETLEDETQQLSSFLELFKSKSDTVAYKFLSRMGDVHAFALMSHAQDQAKYYTSLAKTYEPGISGLNLRLEQFEKENGDFDDDAEA